MLKEGRIINKRERGSIYFSSLILVSHVEVLKQKISRQKNVGQKFTDFLAEKRKMFGAETFSQPAISSVG